MPASGFLTLDRAGVTLTEPGTHAWHALGEAPPAGTRSPVYRDLSGCSFPYIGTNPALVESGGWVKTSANSDNHHAYLPDHGVNTANTDFQVSFMAICTDTSGQGFLSFAILDAGGNGYEMLISNAHHLYVYTAGVRGPYITNFDKVAGAYVPCFVEWTYEMATGEWRCYEDGVAVGNWVDTTHQAVDKRHLLIFADTFAHPENETSYSALILQDYIELVGSTIKRPLPFGNS
jgi:hypothetical protein